MVLISFVVNRFRIFWLKLVEFQLIVLRERVREEKRQKVSTAFIQCVIFENSVGLDFGFGICFGGWKEKRKLTCGFWYWVKRPLGLLGYA